MQSAFFWVAPYPLRVMYYCTELSSNCYPSNQSLNKILLLWCFVDPKHQTGSVFMNRKIPCLKFFLKQYVRQKDVQPHADNTHNICPLETSNAKPKHMLNVRITGTSYMWRNHEPSESMHECLLSGRTNSPCFQYTNLLNHSTPITNLSSRITHHMDSKNGKNDTMDI